MAVWWLTDSGNDANSGTSEGDAKRTWAGVLAVAGNYDYIEVRGAIAVTSTVISSLIQLTFSGNGTASLTFTGCLSSGTNRDWAFHDFAALNGDTTGFINVQFGSVVNSVCGGSASPLPAYRYCNSVGTRFNVRPTNLLGSATECEFPLGISAGNNGAYDLTRCRLKGSVQLYHSTTVTHCSFWNLTNLSHFSPERCVFHGCVMAASTPTADIPKHQNGFTSRFDAILDCYRYNCTIGSSLRTDGVEYTALAGPPFADPDNDIWTPSAELAAITTEEGLTPGAINVAGGVSTFHPLKNFMLGAA